MNPRRTLWLLICFLALIPHAHAQAACPFFTQATAESYLQAHVQLSTNVNANNEGTCTFTAHDTTSTTTLKLTVTLTTQPACALGKPITGIGTQAILCSTIPTHTQTIDTISARVRELYVTLQLTINGKPTIPLTSDQRRTLVQQAAQIFTGNLF